MDGPNRIESQAVPDFSHHVFVRIPGAADLFTVLQMVAPLAAIGGLDLQEIAGAAAPARTAPGGEIRKPKSEIRRAESKIRWTGMNGVA